MTHPGDREVTVFNAARKLPASERNAYLDTACAGDAAFAYVAVFSAHANVGFFHGAALKDPAGLLQGSGKRMRHVKLIPGQRLNAAALANLIDAAYRDIKARLDAEQSAASGSSEPLP